MVTFKKSLGWALAVHLVVLGASSIHSASKVAPPLESPVGADYIETERISSVSVSEEQIQEELHKFSAMREGNLTQERAMEKRVNDLKKQEQALRASIKGSTSRLSSIDSDVKKKKKELKKVEAARNKEGLSLVKKLKEEQAILHKKLLAEEVAQNERREQRSRIDAVQAENIKLLAEAENRNRVIEKKQLARVRGVYEKSIRDALVSNWKLPYMRSRTKCKVELSISTSGVIEKYKILPPCDAMYVASIELAVENTTLLPRAPSEVFKKKEIVNFIDDADGIFVR